MEKRDITKDELFKEFERNLDRIFGFSIERFKQCTRDDGKMDRHFDEEWSLSGPRGLRHLMGIQIACLDYVFMSKELGRNGTFEEFCDRVEELDIGLKRADLVPFYDH